MFWKFMRWLNPSLATIYKLPHGVSLAELKEWYKERFK